MPQISGCKAHPAISLPPEATGAGMEVTKCLKPKPFEPRESPTHAPPCGCSSNGYVSLSLIEMVGYPGNVRSYSLVCAFAPTPFATPSFDGIEGPRYRCEPQSVVAAGGKPYTCASRNLNPEMSVETGGGPLFKLT